MATTPLIAGYYTITEAAEILGKSQSQVSRYVAQGLLPAVDLGHQKLIKRADVRKFTPPPRGNPDFIRDSSA